MPFGFTQRAVANGLMHYKTHTSRLYKIFYYEKRNIARKLELVRGILLLIPPLISVVLFILWVAYGSPIYKLSERPSEIEIRSGLYETPPDACWERVGFGTTSLTQIYFIGFATIGAYMIKDYLANRKEDKNLEKQNEI